MVQYKYLDIDWEKKIIIFCWIAEGIKFSAGITFFRQHAILRENQLTQIKGVTWT